MIRLILKCYKNVEIKFSSSYSSSSPVNNPNSPYSPSSTGSGSGHTRTASGLSGLALAQLSLSGDNCDCWYWLCSEISEYFSMHELIELAQANQQFRLTI